MKAYVIGFILGTLSFGTSVYAVYCRGLHIERTAALNAILDPLNQATQSYIDSVIKRVDPKTLEEARKLEHGVEIYAADSSYDSINFEPADEVFWAGVNYIDFSKADDLLWKWTKKYYLCGGIRSEYNSRTQVRSYTLNGCIKWTPSNPQSGELPRLSVYDFVQKFALPSECRKK